MKAINRLFNKQFILLWQGQIVSQFGTFLFDMALILWIKEQTNLASLMGFILMASSIPDVLLGPIGGTISDLFPKKKILVRTDIVGGLTVVLLSVAFLTGQFSTGILVGLLFITAFVLGICSSIFNPTVSSAIPFLVPQNRLQQANSLYQLSVKSGQFLGQSLGGILFTILGAPVLIFLNGLSFLISALSESFLQIPGQTESPKMDWRKSLAPFRQELKAGFRYVWQNRQLKTFLLILGGYHFFLSPLPIVIPYYTADTLGLGNEWVGFLLASFGIGTVAGFLGAGLLKTQSFRRALHILIALTAASLIFILPGLIENRLLALSALFLFGGSIGFVVVNLQTLIQEITPKEFLGRIFGFMNLLMNATIPVGLGCYGIILDVLKKILPDPALVAAVIFIGNGFFMLILAGQAIFKFRFFSVNSLKINNLKNTRPARE